MPEGGYDCEGGTELHSQVSNLLDEKQQTNMNDVTYLKLLFIATLSNKYSQ